MKPLTLCAICISLAIHCAAAQGGPTKRLDIVDCLELMSEAVFADWWHPFAKVEVLKREIRRAATQPASHFTLDVPNGYLHYPADDGGERCAMTTTLFRQPDGGALIAMECSQLLIRGRGRRVAREGDPQRPAGKSCTCLLDPTSWRYPHEQA